jgi:predicted DNA-binding transcriptional regulator AlpA
MRQKTSSHFNEPNALRAPNEPAAQLNVPRPLLREQEVAAWLNISPKTLRNLRWSGTGGPPFRVIGRLVRYSPDEVDAWLDRARRDSSSATEV